MRRVPKVKDIDGYFMIHQPEHKRANHQGYVKHQIIIWERAHLEALPPGWIVHHVNGVITDNRQENLRAFTNSQHCKFHAYAWNIAGTGRLSCPADILSDALITWDQLQEQPVLF